MLDTRYQIPDDSSVPKRLVIGSFVVNHPIISKRSGDPALAGQSFRNEVEIPPQRGNHFETKWRSRLGGAIIQSFKHGVSFEEAQFAFLDPNRIIAKDIDHSKIEDRFYCFGKTSSGILTVRFTYRNNQIRIIGAGY